MRTRTFRTFAFASLASVALAATAQAATVQWEGQSPIDINEQNVVSSPLTEKIQFFYQPETVVLTNTYNSQGSTPKEWATLKGKPASGPAFNSYVEVNGEKYVLAQFHFHAKSEHTINGVQSPMEVHLVHLRLHDNGTPYCIGEPQSLLVLGALIDEGPGRKLYGRIFNLTDLPQDSSQPNKTIEGFNLARMLPRGASYRYHGSLTAPLSVDCSKDVFGAETELYNPNNVNYNSTGSSQLADHTLGEDGSFPEAVHWVVMSTHLTLKRSQITAFEALFPEGNARPVQDAKSRVVRLMGQ